ncbi:MAG: response regulator [Gammaproteobacteria bacterium]|nr:response regulator [Gammaproteobacteria bacterium]
MLKPVFNSAEASGIKNPGLGSAEGDSLTESSINSADEGTSPLDGIIMVIEDDLFVLDMIQASLSDAGFTRIIPMNRPEHAIGLVEQIKPDIILLQSTMPEMSGLDVLASLRSSSSTVYLPVIVMASSSESGSKIRALELGATEFLIKPVDLTELALRVRNILAAKAYQDHLVNYSGLLEQQVVRRIAELEAAQMQVIGCLARAAEFRDDETGRHVLRVGRIAAVVATRLGCSSDFVQKIEMAAPLHDVGKIGIPDDVLLKPGRLSDTEFELMKQHCEMGLRIIQPDADSTWGKFNLLTGHLVGRFEFKTSPVMEMVAIITMSHHEKWDGSGYPKGLKGTEIPLEGRITAIADVYDAISSRRPYKEAISVEKCLSIIREGRGRHFDPDVVDAFFEVFDEVVRVREEIED